MIWGMRFFVTTCVILSHSVYWRVTGRAGSAIKIVGDAERAARDAASKFSHHGPRCNRGATINALANDKLARDLFPVHHVYLALADKLTVSRRLSRRSPR